MKKTPEELKEIAKSLYEKHSKGKSEDDETEYDLDADVNSLYDEAENEEDEAAINDIIGEHFVDVTDGTDSNEIDTILKMLGDMDEADRGNVLIAIKNAYGDGDAEVEVEEEPAVQEGPPVLTGSFESEPENGNALAKLIGSLKF